MIVIFPFNTDLTTILVLILFAMCYELFSIRALIQKNRMEAKKELENAIASLTVSDASNFSYIMQIVFSSGIMKDPKQTTRLEHIEHVFRSINKNHSSVKFDLTKEIQLWKDWEESDQLVRLNEVLNDIRLGNSESIPEQREESKD